MQPLHHDKLTADIVASIPALRSFARRFYSRSHDVDDLVQETLLKSLANLDRFEEGTHLRSWMFTIMRNTFCSRFQKAKRETLAPAEQLAERATTEAPQLWRLRLREMANSLDRLGPEQRDTLIAVTVDGLSYDAAALEAGCAIGTIKSRINRARKQLSEELDQT